MWLVGYFLVTPDEFPYPRTHQTWYELLLSEWKGDIGVPDERLGEIVGAVIDVRN